MSAGVLRAMALPVGKVGVDLWAGADLYGAHAGADLTWRPLEHLGAFAAGRLDLGQTTVAQAVFGLEGTF